MVRELDEDRAADVASALNGRIRTGETILVRKGESGIEVHLAEENSLQKSHPDLYGQLLAASEQIAQAGTSILWIVALITLTACVAVNRQWVANVGPLPIEKLQTFWTYLLLMVAGFVVSMYLTEMAEARVYHRWKRTLVESLERVGMGRFHLLSLLEGHVEVKSIAGMIKRDQRFELLD